MVNALSDLFFFQAEKRGAEDGWMDGWGHAAAGG